MMKFLKDIKTLYNYWKLSFPLDISESDIYLNIKKKYPNEINNIIRIVKFQLLRDTQPIIIITNTLHLPIPRNMFSIVSNRIMGGYIMYFNGKVIDRSLLRRKNLILSDFTI